MNLKNVQYDITLMKVNLYSRVIITRFAQLTGSIIMERCCNSESKTILYILTGTVMDLGKRKLK